MMAEEKKDAPPPPKEEEDPPTTQPAASGFTALTSELVVAIVQFLPAKDTVRLSLVARAYRDLLARYDELLFLPLCLAEQPLESSPRPPDILDQLDEAVALKKNLRMPTWKLFQQCLVDVVGVPCLGYFRRMPGNFATDYAGQVVHVRPVTGSALDNEETLVQQEKPLVLCVERVHPVESWRALAYLTLTLVQSETTGATRIVQSATGPAPDAHIEGHHIEWRVHKGADEEEVAAIKNGELPAFSLAFHQNEPGGDTVLFERDYFALPPPVLGLRLPNDEVLYDLQDLWSGIYGPHGQEILQLRFISDEAEAGGVLLEGLKLVGDANVPANQWSFRVDVSQPLNVLEALTADTRPVHLLDQGMEPTERILLHELSKIHAVCRGKGQINMVAGRWAPQEVGVDLIVLKPTNVEGESWSEGCWLVWHDSNHTERHCIDLLRVM